MKLLSFELVPILVALVAVLFLVGIFLPGVATSGANNPPTTTTTAITPISTSPQAQGSLSGGDPTCASGSICTYTLTVENSGLSTSCSGADVRITIDNTGSVTKITSTVQQGTSTCTPLNQDLFGYNGLGLLSSYSCGTWSSVGSQPTDFGTFSNVFKHTPDNVKCTTVTFTLSTLVTSFGANSDGKVFVVHAIFNLNTGFITTPVYPIGAILAVLGPLAAVGIYFGARKGFKF
jgi:hypothetical protein